MNKRRDLHPDNSKSCEMKTNCGSQ